jgi:predicted transcriptional regulator
MVMTTINLTDREHAAIQRIARQMGKTEAEVLQRAVEEYLTHADQDQRRAWMEQAQGMWRDRDDLPELETLRNEFERVRP